MAVEETLVQPVAPRDMVDGNDPIAVEVERIALLVEELRDAIRRKLPPRE